MRKSLIAWAGGLTSSKPVLLQTSVIGGARYILHLVFRRTSTLPQPSHLLRKGFVAAFEFYDDGGGILLGTHPGFCSSATFANYAYIQAAPSENLYEYTLRFETPVNASTLHIRLHYWQHAGQVVEHIEIRPAPENSLAIALAALAALDWEQASLALLSLIKVGIFSKEAALLDTALFSAISRAPAAASDALRPLLSVRAPNNLRRRRVLNLLAYHFFDAFYRAGSVDNVAVERQCHDLLSGDERLWAPMLQLGSLAFQRGRRNSAYRLFRRAAAVAKRTGHLPRMVVGANSVRAYSEIADWCDQDTPLPIGVQPDTVWRILPEEAVLTILFGGNGSYFENFALDLVRNLTKLSSAPIHFHIVNWTKRCDRVLAQVQKEAAQPISLSIDHYYDPRDLTWFATVRFFRLAELMERTGGAVLIADMDILFTRDPLSLTIKYPNLDVGIRGARRPRFPWWSPSANLVFVAPSETGRKFASDLRRYIATRFVGNYPATWWFDQFALNEILHFYDINEVPCRVVDISRPSIIEILPRATPAKRKARRVSSRQV